MKLIDPFDRDRLLRVAGPRENEYVHAEPQIVDTELPTISRNADVVHH